MLYRLSKSLGSVILPVKAEAAAVSGLTRYTRSSFVPDLLGKFLGTVLKLILLLAGAWPIPMQPIHPAWCNLAPEWIRFCNTPFMDKFSNSWREVGVTSNETLLWAILPFKISPTIQKSRYPGFADDPI